MCFALFLLAGASSPHALNEAGNAGADGANKVYSTMFSNAWTEVCVFHGLKDGGYGVLWHVPHRKHNKEMHALHGNGPLSKEQIADVQEEIDAKWRGYMEK